MNRSVRKVIGRWLCALYSNWEYLFPKDVNLALMDFYALSLIDPDKMHRHEELAYAMKDAKKTSLEGMRKLLLEALFRACASEIYHFQPFYSDKPLEDKSFEKFRSIINPNKNGYKRSALPGYGSRYQAVKKRVTPEELFRFCDKAFAEPEASWHPSYGGKVWQDISRSAIKLLAHADMVMIDHIIDLEHNSGSIFSKWPGLEVTDSLLDRKRNIENPAFFYKMISPNLQDPWAAAYKDIYSGSMEIPDLQLVRDDGLNIQHIKNPSEEVQLEAVKHDGSAIQHIKNPSEAVQLEAVKQNGSAIRYIKNPSEVVQLEAVKQNGSAIQYIKDPSEKLKLEAAKNNGFALKYIKNPSEAVQLAAVNQSGYTIQFIKNPSEAAQLAAVKQNWAFIQYIKDPSEDAQLEAVNQNPDAFKYIEHPSENVQLEYARGITQDK